jgi:hypothetical protein
MQSARPIITKSHGSATRPKDAKPAEGINIGDMAWSTPKCPCGVVTPNRCFMLEFCPVGSFAFAELPCLVEKGTWRVMWDHTPASSGDPQQGLAHERV